MSPTTASFALLRGLGEGVSDTNYTEGGGESHSLLPATASLALQKGGGETNNCQENTPGLIHLQHWLMNSYEGVYSEHRYCVVLRHMKLRARVHGTNCSWPHDLYSCRGRPSNFVQILLRKFHCYGDASAASSCYLKHNCIIKFI